MLGLTKSPTTLYFAWMTRWRIDKERKRRRTKSAFQKLWKASGS